MKRSDEEIRAEVDRRVAARKEEWEAAFPHRLFNVMVDRLVKERAEERLKESKVQPHTDKAMRLRVTAADFTMGIYRYEGHVYLPLPRKLQVRIPALSNGVGCCCDVCEYMDNMRPEYFALVGGQQDEYFHAMDTLVIGPPSPDPSLNEGKYSYLCHHPALNPANQRYLPTELIRKALRVMGYAV